MTKINLPGGNSEWEPPDPFPNSEVKTLSADGSVGPPHVRVGHRQALILKEAIPERGWLFCIERLRCQARDLRNVYHRLGGVVVDIREIRSQ